jgi:guanine deaminase
LYQPEFMQRAIALSRVALSEPGTEPFGAVVVKEGRVVGEGLNHALAHFDPSSHGEVEAIRDACRRLSTVDLAGCELYTSCEPCALCVALMNIVGIGQLFYASSLAQSGVAFRGLKPQHRHAIDVDQLRAECGARVQQRSMPSAQKMDGEATAVLKAWVAQRVCP